MERRELPRYPVIDAAATGRNLCRLRLEKGYSVKELQEYLGLSCPQGVYQWQAGRSLPSVDNLYAVSRLWGVSMNEILVERESAQNNGDRSGSLRPPFPVFCSRT